jgi:hypothetical protein
LSAENSLAKVGFIPKFGPGKVGFAFKRSDSRLWSDIDGTQRPFNHDDVIVITANRTLLAKESGALVVFDSATSLALTLPAVSKGLTFRLFVKTAAGSGNGHTVKTGGTTEATYGKVSPVGAAIAQTAGKGVQNTQATGVVGDGGELSCDGTNWFFKPVGTWAREP